MKLRNNFTILAVYAGVIGLAFLLATARMRAQNNATASPAPAASASPTPAPSIKPAFSLSTNRTYGSQDRAKIYVNYQGIDALDFRIYKVNDPAKFFKQLNDPHRMGEGDFQDNETVSEVKDSKPGVLEKVHDFKTSVWSVVKNYFRNQLHHESRVEFNVKFRGLGGEGDRLPLNVADFARVPLLNQNQLVTSFRQKLSNEYKYDSKMVIMERREPGVYLVEAVNSQTGKDLRAYTVAIVTDLTMVYKTSDDGEMLVYTVDRKSGQPHGGMNIEVIKGKQTIVKGTADNNGIMRAKMPKPKAKEEGNEPADGDEPDGGAGRNATLILATAKDQFAISDMDAFYFFDRFGDGEGRGNLKGYLYTDRPVYRPNQKVYFKGILRQLTDDGYKVPGGTAHVTIEDPNGGKLVEKDLPLSPRGSFNGEAELAEEAPLGNYSIVASIGEAQTRHYFDVEEYKKPEYKVTVAAPKKFVNVGEKTNFTIEAKYFFGAPVANADVKFYIYRARYFHPWWRSEEDADDFISEGDDEEGGRYYGYGNDMVKEGEAKLGKDGKVNIEFDVPQPDEKNNADFTYRLEAMVTDASRREIEGKGSFVGVRGNVVAFATTDRFVYVQGDSAKVKIRTADYDGKPVSAKVTLRFVKREWDRTENANPTGKWDRYEYKLRETNLTQGEVQTNAQGEATYDYKINAIGSISIDALINDNGKQIPSRGDSIYVTDKDNGWGEYASADATSIKLVSDKKSYRPGETAKVLATLPTEGANLLVTTELEHILTVRTIKTAGRAAMIEVPITDKYAPNVYLSVCYVKDGEFYEQNKLLAVPAKDKFLNLEILPNKKEYKPRETASYTVLARNSDSTRRRRRSQLGRCGRSRLQHSPKTRATFAANFMAAATRA
ncbi:MAG: MG2 domain-containing protein [Blastocatellia bacterium]